MSTSMKQSLQRLVPVVLLAAFAIFFGSTLVATKDQPLSNDVNVGTQFGDAMTELSHDFKLTAFELLEHDAKLTMYEARRRILDLEVSTMKQVHRHYMAALLQATVKETMENVSELYEMITTWVHELLSNILILVVDGVTVEHFELHAGDLEGSGGAICIVKPNKNSTSCLSLKASTIDVPTTNSTIAEEQPAVVEYAPVELKADESDCQNDVIKAEQQQFFMESTAAAVDVPTDEISSSTSTTTSRTDINAVSPSLLSDEEIVLIGDDRSDGKEPAMGDTSGTSDQGVVPSNKDMIKAEQPVVVVSTAAAADVPTDESTSSTSTTATDSSVVLTSDNGIDGEEPSVFLDELISVLDVPVPVSDDEVVEKCRFDEESCSGKFDHIVQDDNQRELLEDQCIDDGYNREIECIKALGDVRSSYSPSFGRLLLAATQFLEGNGVVAEQVLAIRKDLDRCQGEQQQYHLEQQQYHLEQQQCHLEAHPSCELQEEWERCLKEWPICQQHVETLRTENEDLATESARELQENQANCTEKIGMCIAKLTEVSGNSTKKDALIANMTLECNELFANTSGVKAQLNATTASLRSCEANATAAKVSYTRELRHKRTKFQNETKQLVLGHDAKVAELKGNHSKKIRTLNSTWEKQYEVSQKNATFWKSKFDSMMAAARE